MTIDRNIFNELVDCVGSFVILSNLNDFLNLNDSIIIKIFNLIISVIIPMSNWIFHWEKNYLFYYENQWYD